MPVDLSSWRVLVVDDHAINRCFLGVLLSYWGYEHKEVADGPAALDRLRDAVAEGRPFDLVLLDMNMPGMNGLELARRIRQEPALSQVKMIILLSLGEQGDTEELKQVGIAACLTKPIKQLPWHQCLSRVLGQLSPEGGSLVACPATPGGAFRGSQGQSRILVAEDNAINQKVTLGVLARLGYRAEAVADGREAIFSLAALHYDLVLMDCQMPVLDGYATSRAIRDPVSAVLNHRIPIIAMTASALPGDREKCLEAGMDDYLTKPVNPRALAMVLERWLNPARQENNQEPVSALKASQEVVLDQDQLWEVMQGDEAMAREIIAVFLEDVPAHLASLEQALAESDGNLAARKAHSIKGAASNVGGVALRALAARVELLCRDIDLGEAEKLLPQLTEHLNHLNKAFQDLNLVTASPVDTTEARLPHWPLQLRASEQKATDHSGD